jgi:hypothetical protein
VSKRAWLLFSALQIVGCILASYGTMYSESAFVRGSWLCGFLLLLPGNLLPGNLPAMALDRKLVHVRAAYIFFPIAIACNAMLWVTSSAVWRVLRRGRPTGQSYRYSIVFAATGLLFMIVNTTHFLRRANCADCFFPYGLPFTFYHEGGFAGGNAFVWGGLAADVGCVVVVALLVGRIWQAIATDAASS